MHILTTPVIALVAYGRKSTYKISQILSSLNMRYIIVLPDETPTWKPTHIILSGGPKHVYETSYDPLPKWVIEADCSVLAICYGMQIVVKTFGGEVVRMSEREYGLVPVTEIINDSQKTSLQWMNRYDQVIKAPKGFMITGVTNRNHIASITNKKYYCIQWHPENKSSMDIELFQKFLNLS